MHAPALDASAANSTTITILRFFTSPPRGRPCMPARATLDMSLVAKCTTHSRSLRPYPAQVATQEPIYAFE
jgi:hypothetical protein